MGWDITGIDTTKDGNLLVSTFAGGVWMYNARSVKTMSSEDGLPANGWHFNLTTDYENNLWVNNGDGLYKIKDEKIIKRYNKKSGLVYSRCFFSFPCCWQAKAVRACIPLFFLD